MARNVTLDELSPAEQKRFIDQWGGENTTWYKEYIGRRAGKKYCTSCHLELGKQFTTELCYACRILPRCSYGNCSEYCYPAIVIRLPTFTGSRFGLPYNYCKKHFEEDAQTDLGKIYGEEYNLRELKVFPSRTMVQQYAKELEKTQPQRTIEWQQWHAKLYEYAKKQFSDCSGSATDGCWNFSVAKVVWLLNKKGQITQFSYDDDGRMTKIGILDLR